MRSPRLRFLVTLFWFVWTGIIIPVHTRGAIPLIGSNCCHPAQNSDSHHGKSAVPAAASDCAICQLAAHLMPADFLPVHLEPHEFIESALLVPVQQPEPAGADLYFLTRAPPSQLFV